MNYFSSDFKLGILGGGQLGKMLLYETRKYDIYTLVLDPNDDAPCSIACNEFFRGDLMDFETVYNFGKKADLLTIEIENINTDALAQLEKEGATVFPSPKTLYSIQNKVRQKLFYIDHDIPTAPFTRFAYSSEIGAALKNNTLNFPFVWKSARFGYDGQGVKIVKTYSDLDGLPNGECITEDLIDFKNELAVIVARDPKGNVKVYPVTAMEFHPEANLAEYISCPAGIADAVAGKAQLLALKIAQGLQHVGILAVELFQMHNDALLVNEVAPRPHNSGHYSIEAAYTNQFEQHLRAILGLPLGKTDSKVAAVTVNLVGEAGYNGPVVYENMDKILALDGVIPHIYGKKETRPFRKMGHVTVIHETVDTARQLAERVKNTVRIISK
ncbi:MAG: 5-(carboxyamino)imidazole ribonucleotide synthase [Sinomicrobium sp.]|nr:5-(carboxyamino)imidazole ribonucleotide synthase [Sinomicrobium sp.]